MRTPIYTQRTPRLLPRILWISVQELWRRFIRPMIGGRA